MRDLLDAPPSERPVYLAELAERDKLPLKALGMLRMLRDDLSHKGTRDRAVIVLAASGMGFCAEEIADLPRLACAALPEGGVSVARDRGGNITTWTRGPESALSVALRLWLHARDTFAHPRERLFMALGDDPPHGSTPLTPGMVRAILGGYVTPADAAFRAFRTLGMLAVVADAEELRPISSLLDSLADVGRGRREMTPGLVKTVGIGIALQKRAIAFARETSNPLDTRALLARLERGLLILRRARRAIVSQRRIEDAESRARRDGAS